VTLANVQTCLSTGECTESEMQNADSLTRSIQPVYQNSNNNNNYNNNNNNNNVPPNIQVT